MTRCSIHIAHDEAKDRDFELEMSWICAESNNQHRPVPKELIDEAVQFVKASLEEDGDDMDEE
jgi:20S proteasome subunit alpha 7